MSSPFPLTVRDLRQVPGHAMAGEWALPGRPQCYVDLQALAPRLLPGRQPVPLSLTSLCAKPGDWFGVDEFQGPRFERADIRYPGIVVLGMPNPCALPYRMIDGRRRLEKWRRAGALQMPCIILSYPEVEPFIFDFRLQ